MFRFIKRYLPTANEVGSPLKFATKSVSMIRREYSGGVLDEKYLKQDPMELFEDWFSEAANGVKNDPNAMLLSTVDEHGQPSARTVLLKGFDVNGFVFYTNYKSRKASHLENNPYAALSFYWPELVRQVLIEGKAEKIDNGRSDEYFRSRPVASRISAWASPQSQSVASRQELERWYKQKEKDLGGKEIPRPPYWGGFIVKPHRIEFWQGRINRLHDRICYMADKNEDSGWAIHRLAP